MPAKTDFNTSQLLRLRRLFFQQFKSLLFGDVESAVRKANTIETIHEELRASLENPDKRQRDLIFQIIEWQSRAARQWEHCKTELNKDVFEKHVESQIRSFLSSQAIKKT